MQRPVDGCVLTARNACACCSTEGSFPTTGRDMYIDSIRIENFRTYRHAEIRFLHPDRPARDLKAEFGLEVLHPNVNLVVGNNGMGKSALLKAIALGCLGPTVRDSGIFPYRFVRREPGSAEVSTAIKRRLKL